jgi:hypothetical protein
MLVDLHVGGTMQIAWASETPGTTQIAWAPVRDSSIGNTLERSPPKAGFFFALQAPKIKGSGSIKK